MIRSRGGELPIEIRGGISYIYIEYSEYDYMSTWLQRKIYDCKENYVYTDIINKEDREYLLYVLKFLNKKFIIILFI